MRVWVEINISTGLLWVQGAPCARAGQQSLKPSSEFFWENSDIGPQLGVNPPLGWYKIGFRCPRSTVCLILGHSCPNFVYVSHQNTWFWSFFGTFPAIISLRKVLDQKFWVQKKAESLLFHNKLLPNAFNMTLVVFLVVKWDYPQVVPLIQLVVGAQIF